MTQEQKSNLLEATSVGVNLHLQNFQNKNGEGNR